jgi:hypothetical protein
VGQCRCCALRACAAAVAQGWRGTGLVVVPACMDAKQAVLLLPLAGRLASCELRRFPGA